MGCKPRLCCPKNGAILTGPGAPACPDSGPLKEAGTAVIGVTYYA
jgi:hypothetical protein